MKVRELKQSVEKYVQNTLRSAPDWIKNSMAGFIDGDLHMSLKQTTGMIDAYGDVGEAHRMFVALPKHHSNQERCAQLAEWFEAQLSQAH